MDACNMTFEDQTYEIILDKGTFDTIRCTANFHLQVEQYLKEVRRLLVPNGVFVCISHGIPMIMQNFLNNHELGWNIEVRQIQKFTPLDAKEGIY